MTLHRFRCQACRSRWASTVRTDTRCPFCGSTRITGPDNTGRGCTMDLQQFRAMNEQRPLDIVRGGAYPTSRIRRRAVRIPPHADAGNVRHPARSAQAPLRPLPLRWTASEGLQVSCAGKACPPQWRTPGHRAREYTGWRVEKLGAPYGTRRSNGDKGRRRTITTGGGR